MPTYCIQDLFNFGTVEGRAVVADFGGGTITSNAGALLLAKVDAAVGVIGRFAACFAITDASHTACCNWRRAFESIQP